MVIFCWIWQLEAMHRLTSYLYCLLKAKRQRIDPIIAAISITLIKRLCGLSKKQISIKAVPKAY